MTKTVLTKNALNTPKRQWRFGLRDKMRAIFSVITLSIISATFVAWSSYHDTDHSIDQIVNKSIPLMTSLSEVAQNSQNMLALTSSVLLADNIEKIERASLSFSQSQTQFDRALIKLEANPQVALDIDEMRSDASNIQADVQLLLNTQRERIHLAESFHAIHDQIEVMHQEYRMLAGSELVTKARPRQFLSYTNLFLVGLSGISRAETRLDLENQLDRLRPTLKSMRILASHKDLKPIHDAAERIVTRFQGLAYSEASLGSLRREEISAKTVIKVHLDAIHDEEKQLSASITKLMKRIERKTANERATAAKKLNQSQALLLILGLGCGLGSLFLTFIYFGSSVLGRINKLRASMQAIAGGNLEYPIDTRQSDEIGDMAIDLSVFRDAMARNTHIAYHDILTGLGNRAQLDNHINCNIAEGCPGAILYFSLEGLTDITETFGHDIADQVLQCLAERLQASVRPGDIAARIGGHRFIVDAPNLTDERSVQGFATRLADELRKSMQIEELDLEINPFAGIAYYPDHGINAETLMHHADIAMRTGLEEQGGQDSQIYTSEMGVQASHIKDIRKDLKTAIERGDFLLHYQPKMRIRTGQIEGVEALVRWSHPERGSINPEDFIPMAERSGLIIPLGRWILYESCRQAKIWADMNNEAKRVAVNISPVQFLRDDMVQAVKQALHDTGLPPELLELEITEGVFMHHETHVLERLQHLRDMGIHLAIDDFGTGYSSLSYLKKLPVSTLKIDQSFVRNIESNNEDARICRAIIRLAQDLNLEVVAEGIEWQSHLDFLNAESCDIGQGYFISRPLPADKIPEFVANWKTERLALREVKALPLDAANPAL